MELRGYGELGDELASLMEEAVKTLNPQVLVTSKSLVQVELRDAMASLMEELL